MGKILVITNRKGGCGKSFTTASLGVGLARQGKKVLCIDADNQHSLTVSLGIAEPENLEVTLATVIANIIAKKEINPTEGIIHHAEGIDLLPANNSLTGIEITLAPLMGREIILRKYINKVKSLYDYCLIDTAPTLDILTVNALAAADSAIIPVTPMPASKAQQKAVAKYMKSNYDELKIRVPKGNKEQLQTHAAARGESLNGFVNRAINNQMERDNTEKQ